VFITIVFNTTVKTSLHLDTYVIHTLMRDLVGHDKLPSAFLVYLQLCFARAHSPHRLVTASLQKLADQTGLSKSAVQSAIKHLKARGLIRATQPARTATPSYEVLAPWRPGRNMS
jgi:hypothetical protein